VRLLCVGLNHVTAPLALRETTAVAPGEAPQILRRLRKRWPTAEFLLLNTCNRTELYALRPLHARPREEELREAFASNTTEKTAELDDALYVHAGIDAVRHLFSVASGLDSLVPGESQIVSQIKDALATAMETGAADTNFASLVSDALATARRVRRETPIARGKVSVASAAFEAVRDVFPSLADRCVLAIGGGKMTELLLRLLAKENPAHLFIANRSFTRAAELAADFNAQAVPFDNLQPVLGKADVVLTCTASPKPILTSGMLARARNDRNDAPLLIMDLAVPRDVDPRAADLPGVRLGNIDDLSAVVDRTVAQRSQHVDAAMQIVSEQIEQYLQAADIRLVAPTIDALYRRIDETLQEELIEASNKLSTHDDHAEDLDILRRTLHRALRRFCHPAVETLRNQAAQGAGGAHAETLRTLFGLDDSSEK
jgi:glutamyl-tRNA reductase